jgi:DNA-binding NarL/FixJ family response regulator
MVDHFRISAKTMRKGRPIPVLTVTPEERETLEGWTRRAKTGQALAQRARIILACAEGKTNTSVAERLRITKQMVGKWRTRFLDKRLMVCWTSHDPARRADSVMLKWDEC